MPSPSDEFWFWVIIPSIAIPVLFFWYKKQKKLEAHLLKYGVDLKAVIEKKGFYHRGGYRDVYLRYEIHGRTFRKKITVDAFDADKKEVPLLIDPFNPTKVLFNVRKFDLEPVSDDSVKNFLDRQKNYGEIPSNIPDLNFSHNGYEIFESEGSVCAWICFNQNTNNWESQAKMYFEELIDMVAAGGDCIKVDNRLDYGVADCSKAVFASQDYKKLYEEYCLIEEKLAIQQVNLYDENRVKSEEEKRLRILENEIQKLIRIHLTLTIGEPPHIDIESKLHSQNSLKQILQRISGKLGIELSLIKGLRAEIIRSLENLP